MYRGNTLSFRLIGWSAWNKQFENLDEWLNWANQSQGDPGCYTPPKEPKMMLRRRATPIGRTALSAAMGLPAVSNARYVLSTRYGELDRTARILSCLAEKEPVSPADFSMSVHHGLAGLLSIALKNTEGHTAVSGGSESFCYGLLEAASCLATRPQDPVILIHYDEQPKSIFATLINDPVDSLPIVTALCLTAEEREGSLAISMELEERDVGPSTQNHALDFLHFVLTGAESTCSRGTRMTWKWCRA